MEGTQPIGIDIHVFRPGLFFPQGDVAKTDDTNNIFTNYWRVLFRTQFSNPNCRFGFTFRGDVLSCMQKHQNAQSGVRCVRDATDAEINAAQPAN